MPHKNDFITPYDDGHNVLIKILATYARGADTKD